MQHLLSERPALAREVAVYQRCRQLAWGVRAEQVPGRVAQTLAEHTGARGAVALARGEHGDWEAIAHYRVTREAATRVAAAWRIPSAGRPAVRELGEPVAVEVPGRFTVALFGLSEPSGGLEEELMLLSRWGALAAELAGSYGDAVQAESALDPLCGLYDGDYLARVLDDQIARSRASGQKVAVLAVDLDGFREINDAHGHQLGGRIIVEAARILERCVRETDLVARTGGDEFHVMLAATDTAGAQSAGERIRRAFASHLFLMREGLEVKLTVSVGVAASPHHGSTGQELMAASDAAVAAAKTESRNRVVVARER
jgi:diguanylate cyclase (GGDEF)-like protein